METSFHSANRNWQREKPKKMERIRLTFGRSRRELNQHPCYGWHDYHIGSGALIAAMHSFRRKSWQTDGDIFGPFVAWCAVANAFASAGNDGLPSRYSNRSLV